jgi:hypothetical protein
MDRLVRLNQINVPLCEANHVTLQAQAQAKEQDGLRLMQRFEPTTGVLSISSEWASLA